MPRKNEGLDKGLSKHGKQILNSTDGDIQTLSESDKKKLNNNIKSDILEIQKSLNKFGLSF